jgi:hypothetical protein
MPGPTINTTINPSTCMANDAAFRAWGSILSAAIATAGWVQTADTGQINWSTVVRSAGGTAAGYEIWRLNDSLQSTAPIYIKVEYGTGPTTAYPGLWITAGTGSDGAGALTSLAGTGTSVTTRQAAHVINSIDTWPNTLLPMEVNGDGSSLVIALWPNAPGGDFGIFFALERYRNWDNTPNGDGFIVIYGASGGNGNTQKSQSVYFSTTVAQPGQASLVPAPYFGLGGTGSSCVVGNTLYPIPILPGWGFKTQAPMAMVMVVARSDLTAGNSFTLTHYGVAHTFHAMGPGAANIAWASIGSGAAFSFIYRMD